MTGVPVSAAIREAAGRVRSTLPRELIEQALAMYDAGWPPARIAKEVAVGRTTVQSWRRAAGLATNGTLNAHRALPADEMARTVELYESGLTMQEVSAELGIGMSAVQHRLQAGGANIRQCGGIRDGDRPKAPPGMVVLSEAAPRVGVTRARLGVLARTGQVPGAQLVPWRKGEVWAIPANAIPGLRATRQPRRRRLVVAPEPSSCRDDVSAVPGGRAGLPTGPLAAWIGRQIEAGESVEMLAERAGIAPRRINAVTRGEYPTVTIDIVDKLLQANGSSLALVYDDTPAVAA